MFENIMRFFRKVVKKQEQENNSKSTAKERLHLVLMQDRANVSADFLELMKQEIIDVIKKYIDVDENAIDVRLTNKENDDGTNGAPALYANIPIVNIKDEVRKNSKVQTSENNINVSEQNGENKNVSLETQDETSDEKKDNIKESAQNNENLNDNVNIVEENKQEIEEN